MSKLQIATFAALAVLAAILAFPFVLPADAGGNEATVKSENADQITAGYRTCFMARRLDMSGDAPRMEPARHCTTTP